MKRALTSDDILNAKFEPWDFDGDFKESIGLPDGFGSWIIGGESGSGKTTFILQLCKYLLKYERVFYNSLEMKPLSTVMQEALLRTDMSGAKGFTVHQESLEEMTERLNKHKSPNIVVVDSIQYSFLRKKQYKKIKEMFPKKLFIWITHFDDRGKPEGAVARFIWYDCDVKMRTEAYRMFAISRYLKDEGTPITIWKDGAEKYWGDIVS